MKNNKKMDVERNRRIAMLFTGGLAILLFLIFSLRFYQIMIVGRTNGHNLKSTIKNSILTTETLPGTRGNIYDNSGQLLATDVQSYTVYAILTDKWDVAGQKDYVTDVYVTAHGLAKHLNMKEDDIIEILKQEGKSQVQFGAAGSNLTQEVKDAIEAEHLAGVKFVSQPSRYYPNGIFASQMIGFTEVGQEGTEKTLEGKMGLEYIYNTQLTGKNGQEEYEMDGQQYKILGTEKVTVNPEKGDDLYLTLNRRLQTYLETLMTQTNETYKPVNMSAILVDAQTGNILSATQRPTFNGTTKEGIGNMWNNLLVDESFEPGSTMKVLSLAAAINEGVFDPNETYQSGSIKIYDDVVKDYNKVGWGKISYLEGLAHSSNVAFVNLIQKMGTDKWKSYLEGYRFGISTQSGYPDESAGSNPYESYLQQLSTGFGQGISVTDYQMMQAFTAIANGGEMKKLRLVDKVVDSKTGKETTTPVESLGQVVSLEAAQKTLEYLNKAMYINGSTTQAYVIKGEEIATKSGTAQITDPTTGKYYDDDIYIYSVVGFAPLENPRYIFYITMRQPTVNPQGLTGSQILAQVFNPFVKRVIEYDRLNETGE